MAVVDEIRSSSGGGDPPSSSGSATRTPPRAGGLLSTARTLMLPSSVDIYNVMGDDAFLVSKPAQEGSEAMATTDATAPSSVPWGRGRPRHTVELLHRIRMEISVADAFVSRTLCSRVTDTPRIHASFPHILDEPPHTLEEERSGSVTLHEGETLWLSFFLESDDGSDAGNDRYANPFLRISLEKLVRVSQEIDTNVLPVNAVILKYQPSKHDNTQRARNPFGGSPSPSASMITTRIPISLHEVLVGHNLLKEPASTSSSSTSPTSSGLSASRFDDGVFDTLDSVLPSPPRSRIESLGGLADLSAASNIAPDDAPRKFADAPEKASVIHDIAAFDAPAPMEQLESDLRRCEHDELKALLQLEEQALHHEKQQLGHPTTTDVSAADGSDTHFLLDLCRSIDTIDSHSQEIRQAADELRRDVAKSQFLLEAQQIRIVRDLSLLFPIVAPTTTKTADTGSSGGGGTEGNYRIRGLQLPNSPLGVWQGPYQVPEDEVSAALGWTVHVLLCLSRYLSIEMRHPLGFQSSRSYVQDANTNTYYPLFTTRQDRDKFVAGWELLETNADRLLLELRLSRSRRSVPLLARIQQVYDVVVVGS